MKNKTKNYLRDFAMLLAFIPVGGLFSILAGLTPIGAKKVYFNFYTVYIVAGLCIIMIMGRAIVLINEHNRTPQKGWLAKYIVNISFLPVVAGVTSLNLVYASLPNWKWVIPLALMYPVAALLPFVNDKTSGSLHDEAYAPQSRLGRWIIFFLLALGPTAGIFGVILSNFSERSGNGVIGYSILGLMMHFLFIWGEVTMAHQAWKERPWHKER